MKPASKNAHLRIFPVHQVLPYTTDTHPVSRIYVVDGVRYKVGMRSSRFKLFRRNNICVCCGLKGTLMGLDIHKGHVVPHFNLYGKRNGKLVLFTRDHIHAKSKGGKNNISNYQTMCTRCNSRKQNRDISVEELREEILRNPNPARSFKKRKMDKTGLLGFRVHIPGQKVHFYPIITGIGFLANRKLPPPTFDTCHEIVRQRAEALWKLARRPQRRDLEFWLAAERELFGGFLEGYRIFVCDMEKPENHGLYRHYDVLEVKPGISVS